MDSKNLKSILHTSAAEDFPPERIDLWPGVNERLVARNHPLFTQGDSMNSQKTTSRRNRLAALVALTIVFAVVIFFITPQGRALAQDVIKFFMRSTQNTQALPPLAAPVVTVAGPTQTGFSWSSPTPRSENRLPFQDTCGNLYNPRCSVAEIGSLIDFPLRELAVLPEGIRFIGATGGPQQATLVYAGEGLNGLLWLQEEPVASGEQQVWKVAADTLVEAVAVGGAGGEYVQGGWFGVDTNDGALGWHNDAGIQTLRWEVDGLRYSLVFHAAKIATGRLLSKADLLDLAGQLTHGGSVDNAPSPTPALTIEQLSRMTGFNVGLPSWLPEGYTFQEAAYAPQWKGACLFYRYQAGDDGFPLLTVFESQAARTLSPEDLKMVQFYEGKQIDIPPDVTPLAVGGAEGGQAQLMGNGVDVNKLCSYPGLIANRALIWQSNNITYAALGLFDQYQGRGFISRLELQRLAESLNGVSTISAGALDPERLRTIEDAETLAGFKVKAPTRMLADMYFDHAVVRTSETLKEVYLVYSGAPNGDGRRYGFFFSQAVGETQPMAETYLAGGYENLTINAQPAIYREICWSDASGSKAECNQESTWFEDRTRFDIQAYLPGAMEKADYLAIAESMR